MTDTIITMAVISYLITGMVFYLRTVYRIHKLSKEEYERGLSKDWYPPLRFIPLKRKVINHLLNGTLNILLFPVIFYFNKQNK